MTRTLTYQIHSDAQTVKQFLSAQGFSRQTVIALKKQSESILVNEIRVPVNHVLHYGDTLTITLSEIHSSEKILPISLPLNIVYEDEDILVLNKPADMPIHPSLNNYENTLANGVAFYYQTQNSPFVFRCINRLDRDTTGLTIIAKNRLSAGILSEQMSRREISREYMAIVDGIGLPEHGTINAPIGRADGSTIERCVDNRNGEHAVTHYQVEKINPSRNLTQIRLRLETGRTHQIRVHMAYIGYPLAGDFLYNPSVTTSATGKSTDNEAVICPDAYTISRQALHAQKLSFTHPITGEPLVFEAPLPKDMERLLGEQVL